MSNREIPSMEMLTSVENLRVSCAVFADIVTNGRRALIISRARLIQQGRRVLSPIGGVVGLTQGGVDDLSRILEINRDSYEEGLELRLIMHGKHVKDLREWFLTRHNRDVSPKRELKEELIQETGILEKKDFNGIRYEKPGYFSEVAISDKPGQEGKVTVRYIEIYPTIFRETTLLKLQAAARKPNSLIQFVTNEEINDGATKDGLVIQPVSKALINSGVTIFPF